MLPFGDNFGLGAHSVRGAGLGMAWFDLVHGSCYLTGWLFLLGAFRNGDGRFRGSARFLTWLALLLCACVCLRWMARYLLVEPGFSAACCCFSEFGLVFVVAGFNTEGPRLLTTLYRLHAYYAGLRPVFTGFGLAPLPVCGGGWGTNRARAQDCALADGCEV